MVEEREERVAEPADHDALRVGVAQAAPAEPRDAAPQVGVDQLERDDDAEERRDQKRAERGQAVRVDQLGLDVGNGGTCGQKRTSATC